MTTESTDDVSRETESNDDVSRETESNDDVSRETESTEDQTTGGDEDLRQVFDRDYVERLRTKSGNYRMRAKDAEQRLAEVERQLHLERIKRLDMVVEPSEVPYNVDHLEDEAALVEAIEQLLEAKPYLRKRKHGGDIGQHDKHNGGDGFSLLGALKANAG